MLKRNEDEWDSDRSRVEDELQTRSSNSSIPEPHKTLEGSIDRWLAGFVNSDGVQIHLFDPREGAIAQRLRFH